MNNSDFQALVNKEKTTKEIAREAVQDEFSRRRNKRKNHHRGNQDDDYLSDDDSDPPQDDSHKKKDLKRQRRQEPEKEKEPTYSTKYRDRAKERREGKNLDYKEDEALLQNVTSGSAFDEERHTKEQLVELSKYLGGDDAHTHLVKGLDIALAQRVKRQMKGDQDEADLDAIFQQAKQAQKEEPASITIARDKKEALDFLQERKASSFTSDLGKSVYSYLQKTHLPCPQQQNPIAVSSAGRTLQRSSLVFSKYSHPHDKNKSWEIPAEHIRSGSSHSQGDQVTSQSSSCTPLPHNLIVRIKTTLEQKEKYKESVIQKQKTEETMSKEKNATAEQHVEEEDESDDDIFANVGDYVPSSATTSKHIKQEKKSSGSVFAGLGGNETAESKPVVQQQQGGFLSQLRTIKKKGVSMSSYSGDYGEEEMDFDYGGMHDPDYEKEDKKEKYKKKKSSTKEDSDNDKEDN